MLCFNQYFDDSDTAQMIRTLPTQGTANRRLYLQQMIDEIFNGLKQKIFSSFNSTANLHLQMHFEWQWRSRQTAEQESWFSIFI